MKLIPQKFIHLSITVAILLALTINMVLIQNMMFGTVAFLAYVLFLGYILGSVIFQKEKQSYKIILGVVALIATLIIVGSIFYYAYKITTPIIVLIIFLLALIILLFQNIVLKKIPSFQFSLLNLFKIEKTTLALSAIFIILEASLFYIVWHSQTVFAIRSPWWPGIVGQEFFILYFFTTIILSVICLKNKKRELSLIFVILHFFVSTTIAVMVYKLGYGFDPFIHQASEQLIFEHGVILPKTFYYIGQYTLVVLMAKLTLIPLANINTYLIPFFFSVSVPLIVYFASTKLFSKKNITALLPLAFLTLPYSSYIFTTPQSLANIFTLIAIVIASLYLFGNKKKEYLIASALFVITAMFIHPLAGLPAFIFLAITLITTFFETRVKKQTILKKIVLLEVLVLSSIMLPATFLINALVAKDYTTLLKLEVLKNPTLLIENLKSLIPYFQNNFNLVYDIIYVYDKNLYLAFILFSIIGFFVFRKKIAQGWVLLASFIVLFVNFLLLSNFVEFSFLPDYERSNYANRLFEVAIFALVPLAMLTLHTIIVRTKKRGAIFSFGLILFLTSSLTISVYASYPRDDNYHVDRGYNVTQDDIQAVRLIDERSKNDYIVLSSSVTAAASLREFGFKTYYQETANQNKEHFYYSIPTGGPLYGFYVQMISGKTERKVMEEAMDFVGVKKAYFVINKYWWKSEIIIEKAKQNANEWFSINNGQVYVFEYMRKEEQG